MASCCEFVADLVNHLKKPLRVTVLQLFTLEVSLTVLYELVVGDTLKIF